MPRAGRVFVEGGVYHVYNRLARGERVFEGGEAAGEFVGLLRDVVVRDELTVFAWCLMPNHYHMAVRMGRVSLDRPIRSLQQRVTRTVNAGRQVYGPLWQGRYRSKDLRSRRRSPTILRARELLLVVGVERYGVQVKEVAQALGKSADGMTKALARGARRRHDERGFGEELDMLDRSLAETAR